MDIGEELIGLLLLQTCEKLEVKSFNAKFQLANDRKASEFKEKENGMYY